MAKKDKETVTRQQEVQKEREARIMKLIKTLEAGADKDDDKFKRLINYEIEFKFPTYNETGDEKKEFQKSIDGIVSDQEKRSMARFGG